MSAVLHGFLWTLIGVGVSWFHLLLLDHAVRRAGERSPRNAAWRVSRGMPLRLALLTPFLLGAVQAGLVACASLILGLLAGRMVVYWGFVSRQGVGGALQRRG
ncbi:MAG: hypothetical protein FJZ90_05835 [Chloroflexi bacterium]|nr:hypothetical protein [Chloroflexota bacterium]